MPVFTDAAWAKWEPAIDEVRSHGKLPPEELRRTISAIFWRHQNGAKWRSIPANLAQLAFMLAPGQAHQQTWAPGLLGCLPDVPEWVAGDRGFAPDTFRERIWERGACPAIPPKRPARPSIAQTGLTPTDISSRTSGPA
ncbi:hypothetical protein GCM10011504_00030 [Siccirubricoccus deserti]|nr:hypothetical protein GCM10011504_00030 [Siccirubricoccus deserti]